MSGRTARLMELRDGSLEELENCRIDNCTVAAEELAVATKDCSSRWQP